ncbi:MAG: hypothetical protein AAGA78_04070, partial [Pseudomonadota bacterium]
MIPVAQLGALPWVQDPLVQKVLGVLGAAGHQGYFVGGCVRNSFLGVSVQDLDIATDALPEQVMEHAKRAKLKAIGTGIDHGTVTIVGRGCVIE